MNFHIANCHFQHSGLVKFTLRVCTGRNHGGELTDVNVQFVTSLFFTQVSRGSVRQTWHMYSVHKVLVVRISQATQARNKRMRTWLAYMWYCTVTEIQFIRGCMGMQRLCLMLLLWCILCCLPAARISLWKPQTMKARRTLQTSQNKKIAKNKE